MRAAEWRAVEWTACTVLACTAFFYAAAWIDGVSPYRLTRYLLRRG